MEILVLLLLLAFCFPSARGFIGWLVLGPILLMVVGGLLLALLEAK